MHVVMFSVLVFPKQLSAVGVLAVYLLLAEGYRGNFRFYGDQRLCAGCGDREGCVAPVYTKWSVTPLSTEKHWFWHILLQEWSGSPNGLRVGPEASQMAFRWVLRPPE